MLRNEEYIQIVKSTLQECIELYAAFPYERTKLNEISPDDLHLMIPWKLFLDTTLMMIRGKTIAYAKKIMREKNEKENKLNEDIKLLQKEINDGNNIPNTSIIRTLQARQQELTALRKQKIEGIMVRSRVRWYKKGEKNSSYFCHLEKRNYTEKRIKTLTLCDGQETHDFKKILDELHKYYDKLYNGTPGQNSQWWNTIDKDRLNIINNEESDILEGKINYEELAHAVKNMKNNKTPGTDGYPIEFVKFFW